MPSPAVRTLSIFALFLSISAAGPRLHGAGDEELLIVTCARPCNDVRTTVRALGGEVTQLYDNLDAIAVSMPAGRVRELAAAFGADALRKDVVVSLPPRADVVELDGVDALESPAEAHARAFLETAPANYSYNNALTGAAALHAAGERGRDVVVAVIDSGVQAASPALAGTVIGGENLVPAAQDPVASATSRLNDWHGTAVGAMIAAHVNVLASATSRTAASLRLYSPASVFACGTVPGVTCTAGQWIIPVVGTAPEARIYAMKVFPSQGGGAPESRIIAAMDRAITLRRNFNRGVPSPPLAPAIENDPTKYESLNIQVVNMSLGGATLFAGRDLEDQLTTQMLEVGITLVTSAGNDGFAAMTNGSPGTGFGSLTVAAANTAVHERVLRDAQIPSQPVGIGALYRPTTHTQTAYFSSRGPTADGRIKPEIAANGLASFAVAFFGVSAQGQIVSCGSPAALAGSCLPRTFFVSGTSFASPTVAGAAALLRHAVPGASARETREALIMGANPTLIGDKSRAIDQGAGFVDIPASLALLQTGIEDEGGDDDGRHGRGRHGDNDDDEGDEIGAGGKSVALNLLRAGFRPVHFVRDRYTRHLDKLVPGQVIQFFIPSDERTDRLTVSFSNVRPENPAVVNQLFGDDLFVMGVDAPTSFAVHRIENPPGSEGVFVAGNATFTIDDPQTGFVRLAVQGDWTNAGPISADVTIERTRRPFGWHSGTGKVAQDDLIPVTVDVPAGTAQAVFELFWKQNWSRYPTNDLDMYVVNPAGQLVVDAAGNPVGASLSSPERAVVASPAPGQWTILVNGFLVHDGKSWRRHDRQDDFTVRATADGELLKVRR
jgi:subtilisin family serine protease